MEDHLTEAAIAGVIGLVIGVPATYLATFIWPTPWELSDAFLAVGIASFCAGFGGAYGARTRGGTDDPI